LVLLDDDVDERHHVPELAADDESATYAESRTPSRLGSPPAAAGPVRPLGA
jgi:hypothetical protein